MKRIRIGFFSFTLVLLTASCLGKTIIPREVVPESGKDRSDLGTGRRRVAEFGKPGFIGSFPIVEPENDLERTPAPVDDFEEPSDDDYQGPQEIPDEGFFAGRLRPDEGGRKDDSGETDAQMDEIAETDNEIGNGEDEEQEKIPGEILIEIYEETERKDATGDDLPKKEVAQDVDGDDDSPEDEGNEDQEGPEGVTGISNNNKHHSFIFDNPYFNFRQLFKYFTAFEKAFEYFFRRTMDDLPLLNGTYANASEEDVDINGHMFHVITALIKDRNKNSTVYIETLSRMPDSNSSQVVEEEKL